MKLHLNLISTAKEFSALLDQLEQSKVVGLDTEFIRETTFYPKLEIIQVATESEAWLLDFPALDQNAPQEVERFRKFLENPPIFKILHAALGDQECFWTALGVVAKPSLDTAVAASLCGYGEAVGLGNLLKQVLGVEIKKGHARTHWGRRPLPEQLLKYAIADVEYLVELGERLMKELDKNGRREWAIHLSSQFEDPAIFAPEPRIIAERLFKSGRVEENSFGVLLGLVQWRENRVREINVPRRRVADDGVLLDLARVKPKDLEHLESFRGLNRGEIKSQGGKILDAIQKGLQQGSTGAPQRGKRIEPPSLEESRAADLLRTYVSLLADHHQIAPVRLLSGQDYLLLVRLSHLKPEEWVARGVLSADAARLIGDEILAFLHGKRAMSLKDLKVKIIES